MVCLCATCCAKFQHGAVEALDILEQVKRWRARQEGGSDAGALRSNYAGSPLS